MDSGTPSGWIFPGNDQVNKLSIVMIMTAVAVSGCGNGDGHSSSQGGAPGASSATSASGNGGYVPVSGTNVVPVYFEGDDNIPYYWNVPYVDVQVCIPGTSQCVTVDHVEVDTGSSGFRVVRSALNGLQLPAQQDSNGAALNECMEYATTEAWGPVTSADLHMAGEVASNQTMQIVDDDAGAVVPPSCSSGGQLTDTVANLGAKGIIGINQLYADSGIYYLCESGSCVQQATPMASVTNPVAAFAVDNNGVSMQIQPVSDSGATSVSGQLIFGINTQGNNQIGGLPVVYTAASGDINISDGVQIMPGFIDSGTSYYIYPNDNGVPECPDNSPWFCPPSPISVNIDTISADGSSGDHPTSYRLSNFDQLSHGLAAASIGQGGSVFASGGEWYDLGLPFYFNRRIYGSVQQKSGGPMYYAFE